MEADTENKDFKRMVAWKGLKIVSITLQQEEVIIQARRNRKIYYIFCKDGKMVIKDADMKVLDEVQIPAMPVYQSGYVTTSQPLTSMTWPQTWATSSTTTVDYSKSNWTNTINFE